MVKNSQGLEKIWSQVPPDYYEKGITSNLLQKYWHTQKFKIFKKIVKNRQFVEICDAGCAGGHMTQLISQLFPNSKVAGLDIYNAAINHAKKQYPHIKFQQCDLHRIPIKDRQFDLVVCYETIEHVINPHIVIRELQRISKDDATVIIAMDSGNLLCKLGWWIWERTTGKVWKNAHLHPFEHRQLEIMIKEEGFIIDKKIFSHFGLEVTFVLKKSLV